MAITPYVMIFMLVFVRILSLFALTPLLGATQVPNLYKIGLSIFLAQTVVATMTTQQLAVRVQHLDLMHLLEYIVQEALAGFSIGLVVIGIFAAVEFAGELLDVQVGFSIASLISPGLSAPAGILANFYYIIFALIFISGNGLSTVVLAILESFQYLPLGVSVFHGQLVDVLLETLVNLTVIGVQLASPVLLAAFMTNVALALASRLVPQVNVFVVGFPLVLFIGLVMIGILMPGMVYVMNTILGNMNDQIASILQALGGTVP